MYPVCSCDYAANIQYWWSHRDCLWIWTWRVCSHNEIVFVKYSVMWRDCFPCTMYIDEVHFLLLWDSKNIYHKNPIVNDDTCLIHLCQHVQLTFVQHTDRIKNVGLIMNILFQFPVCVAYLVHLPDLQSVWLIEQEIYDQLCTSMKNAYIGQKPVRAP